MPHLRSLRAPTLLAALLAAVLLLSGCGGGGDSDKKAEKSPQQVMEQAKKKFDDASSVQIDLSTKSTPSGGNGVLGATGALTQAPAFQGDVKVVLNGLTATVPITSVDGKVYAKLPLQTKYTVIDPDRVRRTRPRRLRRPRDRVVLAAHPDRRPGEEGREPQR